jgi:hypothetical protein
MGAYFSGFNRSEEVTFEERQFIRAICEEYAKKGTQPVSKGAKKTSPFAQVLEGIEKNNGKKI